MIRFEPMGNNIWAITGFRPIGYIDNNTQEICIYDNVYMNYSLLIRLYSGAKLIIEGKREKGFALNV